MSESTSSIVTEVPLPHQATREQMALRADVDELRRQLADLQASLPDLVRAEVARALRVRDDVQAAYSLDGRPGSRWVA